MQKAGCLMQTNVNKNKNVNIEVAYWRQSGCMFRWFYRSRWTPAVGASWRRPAGIFSYECACMMFDGLIDLSSAFNTDLSLSLNIISCIVSTSTRKLRINSFLHCRFGVRVAGERFGDYEHFLRHACPPWEGCFCCWSNWFWSCLSLARWTRFGD